MYDGLSINASRWAIAHNYHRHRQNIHFQALFESGIVCGLGIHLIEPPELAESEYRQSRCWIEIQPGIAIDNQGNPIILDIGPDREKRTFPVEVSPPEYGSATVYIVLSFVEPTSERPTSEQEKVKDTLQEQFRVDQLTSPPDEHQVEICRIKIKRVEDNLLEGSSGKQENLGISLPKNTLFPQFNELDLSHRRPVRLAPNKVIKIGVLVNQGHSDNSSDLPLYQNLKALSACLSSLYPEMRCHVESVTEDKIQDSKASAYDLLCLDFVYFLNSDQKKVLLPLSGLENNQDEKVRFRLMEIGRRLGNYIDAGGRVLLDTALETVTNSVQGVILTELFCGSKLMTWSKLKAEEHPILREPFIFGAPPIASEELLKVSNGEQFIWISGALSATWRGASEMKREDIRAAQELGINLLQLVWRQRQITYLGKDLTDVKQN
ncbi:hypothetical protein C7293_26895 [filamentous cyanobacterium CCT1]|nr:hypothetical protein C7293_26895 [filamentous cyanobacterium CCT1]PSN77216.1 hypothetical protein C8B47_23225 [filamentous cyanobacterium CCP4]